MTARLLELGREDAEFFALGDAALRQSGAFPGAGCAAAVVRALLD